MFQCSNLSKDSLNAYDIDQRPQYAIKNKASRPTHQLNLTPHPQIINEPTEETISSLAESLGMVWGELQLMNFPFA